MFHKIINARVGLFCAVLGVASLSGCASIVNGSNQIVSVETMYKSGPVVGASCQLNNGKGVYYVTTPGTVTVHRAYDDMSIKCEKENLPSGLMAVKSNTKGMAFGNILFGGIIGAGVDASTGAAYDYPVLIRVMMGETVVSQPPVVPATATVPAQQPAVASATTDKKN